MKKIKVFDAKDFPAYLPKLSALYDDLFADGKGFRSRLVQMATEPLGLSEKVEQLLAQTVEFIHNASLLHDDLVDRSALRRGKTTAWVRYSPEYAVLAGDYLLARVMTNLSNHGNVRLIQYTAEVISNLLEGEWIQDSLVRDWDITLSQLDRVHNLKTGSLFKWCLRAPFIAAERLEDNLQEELEELGTILGLLFQRSDDLLDFDVRNHEGKATLGDLKAGYLNSFSVWLLQGAPPPVRAAFVRSQTLADVHRALGDGRFAERLAAFDAANEGLIELYAHRLERLSRLLTERELGWLEEIRRLPQLLYWRNK